MIDAADFIEPARRAGFTRFAGVPCSFFRSFINYVIDDPNLIYISSANEGDAVAAMAGSALGGQPGVAMMQNSGLGNAVSPLTSLNWVFRLPLLLIVTWRGEPGVRDEPQHELMGQITHALLEQMQIPWETFPDQPGAVPAALERAQAHLQASGRPYALVMPKNTVSEVAASERRPPERDWAERIYRSSGDDPATRPTRRQALERVIAQTPPDRTVLLATTGYTGRELYALADRPNQLYMVGSMGCVSALGLGLALARPDLKIVVIDGDGAALMRLGNLATVGAYAPGNYRHLLLDNGLHESTGGQATVSPGVSFARIAQACGYGLALEGGSGDLIADLLDGDNGTGPRFAHLRLCPGTATDLPRPAMTPAEVRLRLMQHIGVTEKTP